MKRIIKNPIFTFIVGAIIFGTIGVYAVSVASKDVTYNNTNVESAINDLYSRVGNISGNIDLEDGKYVMAYDASSIHKDLPTAYDSNFYINKNSLALCNVTSYTTLNARGYNIRIIGIKKDGTIDQYFQPNYDNGPIYDITDYSYIILWSSADPDWGAYPWVTK